MSDAELIQMILNGNAHAFRFLVEQHRKLVWHLVFRMVRIHQDAEDLTQEVFIRVYKDLKKFRGESKLSTWIASVAYHMSIDFIRRKGREKTDPTDNPGLGFLEESGKDYVDSAYGRSEVKQLINRLVESLPLHYRTLITLFYLEEMSYREITGITGMPEGTVKSYLSRARELIRVKVEKEYPEFIPV